MKIHNHLNTISPIPLWQNILSYLIIFVGQLFVYLPVLTNKYLLPDDYEYLYEGLIHSDKFTVQAIAQARLFNALVAPALAWIGNIDDMWIIRLIGLLGIFALAICLFHTFKKYGENIFLSAIFALPRPLGCSYRLLRIPVHGEITHSDKVKEVAVECVSSCSFGLCL